MVISFLFKRVQADATHMRAHPFKIKVVNLSRQIDQFDRLSFRAGPSRVGCVFGGVEGGRPSRPRFW
jgi:hypothetical protein